MIGIVRHDVRSLKKILAYAPNIRPSRKNDQYCAARQCQVTKNNIPYDPNLWLSRKDDEYCAVR